MYFWVNELGNRGCREATECGISATDGPSALAVSYCAAINLDVPVVKKLLFDA
jgi:hypothetical protein